MKYQLLYYWLKQWRYCRATQNYIDIVLMNILFVDHIFVIRLSGYIYIFLRKISRTFPRILEAHISPHSNWCLL